MKTENKVRLVGKLKTEPYAFNWGGVSLSILVPAGLTSEMSDKETTMKALAVDNLAEEADKCREGDLVKVEGFLRNYQDKKTGNWQTQVKATNVERLAYGEPDGTAGKEEPEDDMLF